MSQPANPLSVSEPWNLVADGYAETTMIVFGQYAARFRLAGDSLVPTMQISMECRYH